MLFIDDTLASVYDFGNTVNDSVAKAIKLTPVIFAANGKTPVNTAGAKGYDWAVRSRCRCER